MRGTPLVIRRIEHGYDVARTAHADASSSRCMTTTTTSTRHLPPAPPATSSKEQAHPTSEKAVRGAAAGQVILGAEVATSVTTARTAARLPGTAAAVGLRPRLVAAVQLGGNLTRIRIGDPNLEITGQHRCVLAYTLLEAQLSTGTLALDTIGTNEDLLTERFEVVVTGLQLIDPQCHAAGGC
jgi:hypothetical protein